VAPDLAHVPAVKAFDYSGQFGKSEFGCRISGKHVNKISTFFFSVTCNVTDALPLGM
jgi:hypothetical protein